MNFLIPDKEPKMTESEIMRALECAYLWQTTDVRTYKGIPIEEFSKAVLDLINRKNAKIEKLNFENLQMVASIKELRAEAIKEFAEMVKMRFSGTMCCSGGLILREVNKIAKEMGVEL